MPSVSVIIVNYNGLSHLKECLDSLRGQTFRDFETILVDNASADNSAAFVKEHYPEVSIIENRENLGYGGGNNAGIRKSQVSMSFSSIMTQRLTLTGCKGLLKPLRRTGQLGCARQRY